MTVRVTARGLVEADAMLELISARIRRPRDAFRGPVLDDVLQDQQRFWRTRGERTWESRDPDTARRHGGTLMHVSGRLERAASSPKRRAAGRAVRANNRGLTFTVTARGRIYYSRFVAARRGLVADPSPVRQGAYARTLLEYIVDGA